MLLLLECNTLLSQLTDYSSTNNQPFITMPSDPPLSSAFRTWFNDTGPDGSPAQPVALTEKYQVEHGVLGRGSFAIVRRVILRATGEERAMKVIAKRPLNDKNEVRSLWSQVGVLDAAECCGMLCRERDANI